MTAADVRRQVVDVGASLFRRGLTHGRTGNLSVRAGEHVVVTPTGASLGELDAEALSVIDLDGASVGGAPPTKEAFLHAAIYRSRPGAGAVVHLHSVHAAAVSCLDGLDPVDVMPPLTAYYVMRVGRLPLLPYAAPGDASLADAVERAAREHSALLLANHGPVVSGPDLAAAADAAEELEQTARLFLLLSGRSSRPLTPAQVADLEQRWPRA